MNADSLFMGVSSPFESTVMHCTMTYGGDGGEEGGAEGGDKMVWSSSRLPACGAPHSAPLFQV